MIEGNLPGSKALRDNYALKTVPIFIGGVAVNGNSVINIKQHPEILFVEVRKFAKAIFLRSD